MIACIEARMFEVPPAMPWRRRAACAVSLVACVVALAAPAPAAANCKIGTLEMPVAMVGSRAVATVGINGTQAPMIVDTGAFYSLLTEATAAQLGLRLRPAPFGMWVEGLTGRIDAQVTKVKSLQLMKGELPNIEFLVGGNDERGTMGLLGRNVLNATDVEYDLAHGVIRFVQPNADCDGVNMAYWAGETPVSAIDLESGPRDRLPALKAKGRLNGKEVELLFDSGASSMVMLDAAKRASVTAEQMTPAGRMHGAGRGDAALWTAPFKTFELGGERIENNRLLVADTRQDGIDMLLGVDFFLSHRIYVSQKQQRMFFTYNGGTVFRLNHAAPEDAETPEAAASSASGVTAETLDADGYARRGAASASRGEFVRALADLDRACELAPTVAAYHLRRGMVHLALKQKAPALADLDDALRLDPALPDARLQRAALRENAGDRAGTLDDLQALDKALPAPSQMRLELARFYTRLDRPLQALQQWNEWIPAHSHDILLDSVQNQRCWTRAMLNIELEQALDDCDEAVDADSKNANYLDSRGWVYLRLGKFGKAVDDFNRSLGVAPHSAWSLYGRGIAHQRLGDTDKALADIEAARKARPSIEADAARHGIVLDAGIAKPPAASEAKPSS